MKREYYELPTPSKLMKFLWNCAGGDRYLLERSTYSDQIKYMCLGGIVFATGAMAGLAGGYAFYTIFSPKTANVLNKTKFVVENSDNIPTDLTTVILAVIFGCIWGLIIFNIDRFIVTSTGKGDGTEKITMDEFKTAIPRIIMGIIIAITISKPIEIRMFQSEIAFGVKQYQDSVKGVRLVNIQGNFDKTVVELKKGLSKIQLDIDKKEKEISESNKKLQEEITGNRPGYGERARNLERLMNATQNRVNDLKKNPSFINLQKDINSAEIDKQIKIKSVDKEIATLDGLLLRIKLCHKLSGFWISLFITLLFMAIELTPIFFKLMLTKTTYDYLTENRDELIKADYGIEVKYDYYEAKTPEGKIREGVERHLVINHDAERKIFEKIMVTEIQKELTEYAVSKYKEREMKRIDSNLDEYINKIKPNNEPASEI
jgi:Domain of unknown function (DUF4407)